MTTCSRFSIGIAGLWEEEDAIGFGVEEANAELLLRVRGGCIPILHTIQNTIHKLNCGGLVRWGRRVAADFVNAPAFRSGHCPRGCVLHFCLVVSIKRGLSEFAPC